MKGIPKMATILTSVYIVQSYEPKHQFLVKTTHKIGVKKKRLKF